MSESTVGTYELQEHVQSSYNAQADPSQGEEWHFGGGRWVFPLIPVILVTAMILPTQTPLFYTLCQCILAVLIGSLVS